MDRSVSKLPVLLVEDDQFFLKFLTIILEDHDFDLRLARDGKEGLEHYRETEPVLIITDIHMPVMDGVDMIREIRTADAVVPIIAISSEHELNAKAMEAGANTSINKPFNKPDIDQLIRTLLPV